ncbi:MAG: glycosyltransferase [Acetobacteraceae bacterium]|nr:glycosyltransferase [Pseudomonadota bacterium]
MSGLVALSGSRSPATVTGVRQAVTGPLAPSVVIYLHDLAGGGVERQSLIIANEFRRSGLDVTLLLHRATGPLLDSVPAGMRIVDLQSTRTLQDIPRLMRFLRREKPDILLANLDLNNIAALVAKGLSLSRTKVVICQHNPISPGFGINESRIYRFVGPAYRLLSPLISHAIAVSAGVAEELMQLSRLCAERVATINNPVVGEDFQHRCNQVVEHPWFDQPGVPVFVTAGRLVAHKDHDTLLRAFALYRKRRDGRLMVLGSGPLRERLEELARELGLSDAVHFLGYQPDILPYVRRADAFVLSSVCEGFGNVLVEAMGCGTPVISTRCAHGPAEILAGGTYGVLVEPGSAESLAAGLDQIGSLKQRFPPEMLRKRAAEFSYAACSARYIKLFSRLVPHRSWAAQ